MNVVRFIPDSTELVHNSTHDSIHTIESIKLVDLVLYVEEALN